MSRYFVCKLGLTMLTVLACGVTPVPLPTATIAPTQTASPPLVIPTDPPVAPFVAVVTASILNVRECAGLSCDVIGILHEGDAVTGFCREGWCNIGIGWIWRGCTSDPLDYGCEAK